MIPVVAPGWGGEKGRVVVLVSVPPAPAVPVPSCLDDPAWCALIDDVLEAGGPEVVAQPIVDVAHARVGGFELLAVLGTRDVLRLCLVLDRDELADDK